MKSDSTNIIVAQLGARMHYAVPQLLHESSMLERFYTDSFVGNKRWLASLVKVWPECARPHVLSRWIGRDHSTVPMDIVVVFEVFGWKYWWKRRRARNFEEITSVYASNARLFCRKVLRHGFGNATAVWGFNGASLEIFREAKERGLNCILEQTIAPRRVQHKLLAEELEMWRGWQPTMVIPRQGDELADREEEEWTLADRIISGSEFVTHGLQSCGVVPEKCRVVPYGIDLQRFPCNVNERKIRGDNLRVLFVGEVGLRKGVPYLLEAIRELNENHVDVRCAGRIAIAQEKLTPYTAHVKFLGSVPRLAMSEMFRWADVLVLPSICEGSATVIYEALASGVPVVTTANAGSLVRDQVDGHIVEIRNSHVITDILRRYLDEPDYLVEQSKAAISGRARLSTDTYKAGILNVVKEMTATRCPQHGVVRTETFRD